MGTSTSSKGGKKGSPFDPEWLAPDSGSGGGGAGDGDGSSDGDSGDGESAAHQRLDDVGEVRSDG